MGRYVFYTRSDINGSSGGSRRLRQLHEIVKERFASLEVVCAKDTLADSISDKVLYSLGPKGYLTGGDYALWAQAHRDYAFSLTFVAGKWARSLGRERIEMAFVDDPIYFLPLMKKLSDLKVPVVAMCQNIESLSAQQTMPEGQALLLKKELEVLSTCAGAVTISREEDFLLANMGINSVFFPYYPVDQIVERLRRISEERKAGPKKGLLVLGTMSNAPTRDGIEKIVAFWKQGGYRLTGERLLVAGFGTESIKDSSGEGVDVLGSISDEELDRTVTGIKACLCYQEQGSGALTKIPEMLIAGVPVVANSRAARTYYNMPGVYEFASFEDAAGAVRMAGSAGEFPPPEKPDKKMLLQVIDRSLH